MSVVLSSKSIGEYMLSSLLTFIYPEVLPAASDLMEPRLYCLHSLYCPSCRAWGQKESSTKGVNSPTYNCNSVVNCFRYLLPRLLLLPIFQFFQFYRLANALYAQTVNEADREHLEIVLEYLLSPRLTIRSILTRYPDLLVQLTRLLSTGHLVTTSTASLPQGITPPLINSSAPYHRSYSASPAQAMTPPIRRDSSAHHQHHLRCNTPPLPPPHHYTPPQAVIASQTSQQPASTAALMIIFTTVGACGNYICGSLFNMDNTSSTSASQNASASGLVEEKAEEHMDAVISSLLATGVCAAVTQAKIEELERLTGGKDRLLNCATSNLGRYVMGETTDYASLCGNFGEQTYESSYVHCKYNRFVLEGRLLVREEGKRVASERHAYLFTNCLLLCKRVERRGTGLASSSMVVNVAVGGQSTPLRVKRRISFEGGGGGVHVIDATPYLPNRFPRPISGETGEPEQPLIMECASLPISAGTSASLSRGTVSDSTRRLHSTLEEAELCSFTLEFFDADQRQLSGDGGSADGSSANVAAVVGSAPSNSSEVPQGVLFHYIHFEAPTPEEKADWMASLLSITTSRIYERYLRTLPKLEIPLRLPSPDEYRFVQPDTPDVIVFEPPSSNQISTTPAINTAANRLFQTSLTSRVRSASATASVDEPPDSFDELGEEDVDLDLFSTSPTDDESLGGGGQDNLDDLTASLPLPTTSSRIHSPHLGSQNLPPTTSPPTVSSPLLCSSFHRPQILYASLYKLIERLTYPAYFDPFAVNAFLMYYRRYISPVILLSLLEERYNVPYPNFTPDEREKAVEDMKRRFCSAYKRRVQERVFAFLLQWTRTSRFYAHDFAGNLELRERLARFLGKVRVRILLPAVQAIGHALAKGGGVNNVESTLISPPMTNVAESENDKEQTPAPLKIVESGNTHRHHVSLTPPLSPNFCSTIDLLQSFKDLIRKRIVDEYQLNLTTRHSKMVFDLMSLHFADARAIAAPPEFNQILQDSYKSGEAKTWGCTKMLEIQFSNSTDDLQCTRRLIVIFENTGLQNRCVNFNVRCIRGVKFCARICVCVLRLMNKKKTYDDEKCKAKIGDA
ncbi:hypothetical protein ACTXT7_010844 [Hymenolepis weldensis]